MKKIVLSEKNKKRIKFCLLMFVLSLFACYPYLDSGTIFAHDLVYHLNRIMSTADELARGVFPVFIHSNLLDGFGYGNPLFYPELFLYPAILLYRIGVGALVSYKLLILLITFGTLCIMYYAARVISKDDKVAFLTTLFYTFSMYRIVDIYARGALGEVLAFAFLPLIVAGIYDLIFGDNKRWYLICFGFFGLINSHVLSFTFGVVLVVLICLINCLKIFKDKKKTLTILLAGVLSILLILSFMLPYLEQKAHDTLLVDVHENGAESLIDNAAGVQEAFWNTIENTDTYTSKGIGILLLILPITLFMIKDKKEKKEYTFYVQLYVLGMVIWLVSINLFPWEKTGLFEVIQFPFRLNLISTLLLSFVTGYSVYTSFDKNDAAFKVLVLIVLIMGAKYLSDVKINPHSINFEILMSGPKIGNGEYKPINFADTDKFVYNMKSKKQQYIDYDQYGSKIEFDYNNKEDDFKIHVPLTYYYGYRAYIIDENNVKHNLFVDKNEVDANLVVSSGERLTGRVVVEYKMTPVQAIGYIISLFVLIVVVNYVIYIDKIRLVDKYEDNN